MHTIQCRVHNNKTQSFKCKALRRELSNPMLFVTFLVWLTNLQTIFQLEIALSFQIDAYK